jgi:hypothetical protein
MAHADYCLFIQYSQAAALVFLNRLSEKKDVPANSFALAFLTTFDLTFLERSVAAETQAS